MRVFSLGLFVFTFLSVIWAVSMWAFPLGQVDNFYSVHQREIQKAVGDEQATDLMAAMGTTIVQQSRQTVLAVGIPLMMTTFGWWGMFVKYTLPRA